MKLDQIAYALDLCREAKIAPFLWGHRGVGKSETIAAYCRDRNLALVDMRLADRLAEDLRGYPVAHGDIMRFLRDEALPDPEDPGCGGLIFLDELPRADRAVLNAAFQLIYDRRVGEYRLPDGWWVVAAGNPQASSDYIQSGIYDSALLDRFCHIVVGSGEEYRMEWAQHVGALDDVDPDFMRDVVMASSLDTNVLGANAPVDLGFTISPSPRSWTIAGRAVAAARKLRTPEDVLNEVLIGLVGAGALAKVKQAHLPFLPEDIRDGKATPDMWPGLERRQIVAMVEAISMHHPEEWLNPGDESARIRDFLIWVADSSERDVVVRLARCNAGWSHWIGRAGGGLSSRLVAALGVPIAGLKGSQHV